MSRPLGHRERFNIVSAPGSAASTVLQDATVRYRELAFLGNEERLEDYSLTMEHLVGNATQLVVSVVEGGDEPAMGMDESYSLAVREHNITLAAATVFGALRGLETFAQLLVKGRDGVYFADVQVFV